MSIYKSIAKNYTANGIGLGIRFLEQIALVPLFISFWGITKYADWVLITAFSSFFAMADIGLNTVTTNEFVIKYQQKEYTTCIKLFTNTSLYITIVGVAVLLSAFIFALTNGFKSILQVSVFSEFETSFIFILLLFKVFVTMYTGVYHGIFRATSNAHVATMIGNITKLAEVLILIIGLLFKINILSILVAYIIPILICVLYQHFYVKRWFKLQFSSKFVDLSLLKSLIKPSFAFMLTPLGWVVSNQGMIFVVNALLGPIILIAFTTVRTLVNFLRSLMNLLAAAIWPEVSIAYGKQELHTITKLYHRSFIITGVLILGCVILLIFIGEPVYLTWTKHAISFNPVFFYSMLLGLFVSCLWGLTVVISLATNNHVAFSVAFLMIQLIAVVCVYLALIAYPNIAVIPIVLFFAEAGLLWYTMKNANQLLNSNFRMFKNGIVQETKFLIRNINKLSHIFVKL